MRVLVRLELRRRVRRRLRRMRELTMQDLVGLGFRQELAAGIAQNLHRIDVVEVLAEDALARSRRGLRALRLLSSQVPVVVHGVSLGLASATRVDEPSLSRLARVVGALEPRFWSEHLAFVRAGGVEIGHLAAPPRTAATLEGTARNLARARAVVGAAPLLENVATLVDPPGDFCESCFTVSVLENSSTDLLLDLHNLHANAQNHGFDALAFVRRLPPERIAAVHLAGGRAIGPADQPRLLDDHLHPVPPPVFALLEETAAHATRPLTVILERDGRYPPMADLLAELDCAREALARGRARRAISLSPYIPKIPTAISASSDGAALETLLARLYTNPQALADFTANPRDTARRAGLATTTCDALARLNQVDLSLAAQSFAKKRASHQPRSRLRSLLRAAS